MGSKSVPSPDRRDASLDGLRAIAVLAVIASHAGIPVLGGAGTGVDVFFVLSGYLITSILKRGIDLRDFYVRRMLRLYPALLALLAVYVVAAPLLWPGGHHLRDAALAAAYLTDFSTAMNLGPHYLGHTWSLAVEAQFYLVWPFVLPLILRRRRPALILAGLHLAATALRFVLPYWVGYFTHFSGLLLGALIVFLPSGKVWPALFGLFLVGCSFYQAVIPIPDGIGIIAAEIGAALIIAHRGPSALNTVLAAPPFAWLGLISYGLYLWHFPIMKAFPGAHWSVALAAGLGLSIGFAALSFYTVERWARRARRPRAPAAVRAGPFRA